MVGAHPALGELIAQEVLKLGLLQDALTLSNGFEQTWIATRCIDVVKWI